MDIKSFVEQRLQHAKQRFSEIEKSQGENAHQHCTYFGGQALGIWQGKISAYETILDELECE